MSIRSGTVAHKEQSADQLYKLGTIFGTPRPVIGAIHFLPLIGYGNFSEDEIFAAALQDLKALEAGGADAVVFENNYDIPHKILVGPDTVAMMTRMIHRLGARTGLTFGVSVLWNDYKAALHIAVSTGGLFIRVPVFVDHVNTNYGEVIGDADEVIEYRKYLGAEHIQLFTDIHVKHSAILNTETIEQSALKAIAAGSDALIITGKWTGDAPDCADLRKVRASTVSFPIIVGSGANEANAALLRHYADGVIVSTSIKDGNMDKSEVNLKPASVRISQTKTKSFVIAFKDGRLTKDMPVKF